jgi:tRNA G18 (ribose-2'-O)-methylase SpoU
VTALDDAALADFVALNDPARRRRVERDGGYFVVEGLLAIEKLLSLPRWHVRALALLPRLVERMQPLADAAGVEIKVVEEDVLRQVVGFDLHRGALASVDRRPPAPLAELVAGADLVVVTEGVNDHENLGAIYRNAAAFGAAAVLLDPTSADPFYRRSVRVSLGHVLAVPTGAVGSLPDGIDELHDMGVTTVALTPSAEIDLRDLDPSNLGEGPLALLVGAEGPGLTAPTLAAAQHRVRIDMADGVDSINVAAATAVALHHLR